ncbi:MAG: helix-turn-helix domain-containing protein [Pseudomonadota bacterium]
MTSYWFPDPELCASRSHFSYETFDDFDQQAERVQNMDARYTQLTAGKFAGKSLSLTMKDITLHIEAGNQSVEAQVNKPVDRYTFCVPLALSHPFTMFGEKHEGDWVDINTPKGTVDAVIPSDSVYALIPVSQQAILESVALVPEAADLLMELGHQGAVLKSRDLARSLRSVITTTLETAAQIRSQEEMNLLAQSFILQFGYTLSIAWLKRENFSQFVRTAAFERFYYARKHLLEQLRNGSATDTDNKVLEPLTHLGSKRSIEQAFSQHITMGPLTYWRVVRLHNARRKLIDPKRRHQPIGDIAAEEGFWEFSRFSMQYRKHFGERPSDTRKLANQ